MKVRKKPVTVEAWPWPEIDELALKEGIIAIGKNIGDESHYIETLEGTMKRSRGDWLIKGVHGEYYACKPDIFEKTYDILMEGSIE